MKAVLFHHYGDVDVLRYEDVDVPTPGAGEVLVRVAATTFNGVDANIRAGFMQEPMPLTLPHTPGIDIAGTVEAVGADVADLAVGDRVVGLLPFVVDGASAELALVPVDHLTASPTSIALTDAAALPLVGLTAWQALFDHADLQRGQRVLIVGASGAVGGYAVQLAAAAGAHVVATGGPRTNAHLRELGAAEVVEPIGTAPDGASLEPFDVVLNLAPIAPEQLAGLADLVTDGGVVVNTTVWMPAPEDEARGVRGIDLYVRPDVVQLAGLVDRVDRGELVVTVAERVALPDLPSVHARAAAGTLTGKTVIVVDDQQ